MLQIGVEGALDEEGDQHLRSGRPFIIRIFFQNQIPDAAFQLSDQNASAAAGKKDFQKSGLTGKGAENFQRRLFWIIKEGIGMGDGADDVVDQFILHGFGQIIKIRIMLVEGCLVDESGLCQLFYCNFFDGLPGTKLDKGISDIHSGSLYAKIHDFPSFLSISIFDSLEKKLNKRPFRRTDGGGRPLKWLQ